MGIKDQLGDEPPFDRIGTLQELFDQTTKVQLDAGDLIAQRLANRPFDDPVTVAELTEVLEVALAAVQGTRQCLLEIHFAITGEPPKGA